MTGLKILRAQAHAGSSLAPGANVLRLCNAVLTELGDARIFPEYRLYFAGSGYSSGTVAVLSDHSVWTLDDTVVARRCGACGRLATVEERSASRTIDPCEIRTHCERTAPRCWHKLEHEVAKLDQPAARPRAGPRRLRRPPHRMRGTPRPSRSPQRCPRGAWCRGEDVLAHGLILPYPARELRLHQSWRDGVDPNTLRHTEALPARSG